MIKCALISGKGMGIMHGKNFHSHADSKVVAVCDMDPQLLAKAKAEFNVPGYTTIEETLANSDAELYLLITNETRRIPPLRQLIAAGKHVFTEKPLCGMEGQYRVREQDAAIAAPGIKEWRKSGLKFGIDYNYRFFVHFQKLHNDVSTGKLGQIRLVRARAHFNCWSHVIDQILWNMGLPEWVSVMGNPAEEGGWTRMIRMKWANGVIGQLDGTNLWGYDDHPLRLMIVGTEAYAEARGLGGWYRRAKANAWPQEVQDSWEREADWKEYQDSFPRMADGVVKAMLADQPFPATGDDAWNELLFEAAVHRSASNNGQRVMLVDVEDAAMAAAKGCCCSCSS
jgi:predicted dehydrogenase